MKGSSGENCYGKFIARKAPGPDMKLKRSHKVLTLLFPEQRAEDKRLSINSIRKTGRRGRHFSEHGLLHIEKFEKTDT